MSEENQKIEERTVNLSVYGGEGRLYYERKGFDKPSYFLTVRGVSIEGPGGLRFKALNEIKIPLAEEEYEILSESYEENKHRNRFGQANVSIVISGELEAKVISVSGKSDPPCH